MKDHILRTLAVAALTLLVGACGTYSTTDRHQVRDGNRGYATGAPAQGQELVCHKGKKTLSLPEPAVAAHLGHGDRRGRC